MPRSTVRDITREEPSQLLAAVRRARYGDWLALHLVLWCAAGRTPTEMAAVLFCARSRVYRTVRAYRQGTLARYKSPSQGRRAMVGGPPAGDPALVAHRLSPGQPHRACLWRCA
jgi:hypothetical protein